MSEQNTPTLSDDRKKELKAAREAQKRLTWINNVKRIYNWDQETAEREWTKIHTPNQ